jgi:hypothetical protein
VVGEVGGRSVAFVPRHGADHRFPPHRIPYRANLWALRSLGVRQVLAPCAVGSLQPELGPARSWCATSWSTAPAAGADLLRRRPPCTCPSPTPTARRARDGGAAGGEQGWPVATAARWSSSRAAVLHPRRVAVVRRAGLVGREHDRPPRGGAGPRAGALLHRRWRWSPTSTPAWRAAPPSPRRGLPVFAENTDGCGPLLLDVVEAALPAERPCPVADQPSDGTRARALP